MDITAVHDFLCVRDKNTSIDMGPILSGYGAMGVFF
jgi:hypothetical protein